MKTRKHDPIAVALGLALAILPATAQVDPESICAKRADTLFKSGSEALDQVSPIGLQDCSSLENDFDDDVEDANPLVVPLAPDEACDFATLRTLADESTRGAYTAVALDEVGTQAPLPDFCSFDSEFGVTSCEAPAGTTGEFLVEYNVVLQEGFPGSVNPLFVVYDFGGVAPLSVEGLDFECDGSLTAWPYQGNWFDANDDGTIDQPWAVYENKFDPAPACVMTDKPSISLSERGDYELPPDTTLNGNRIEMKPADGLAGQTGTLELLITDNGTGATRPLDVPYQVVPKEPEIVGLSYSGQNGTIDNPVDGSRFEYDVEIPCTVDNDEKFVVTRHYDPDMSYQIINNPPGKVSMDPFTGAIVSNYDCGTDIGWDFDVSVRAQNTSAASLYKTGTIRVTNGVSQQSSPSLHGQPHQMKPNASRAINHVGECAPSL